MLEESRKVFESHESYILEKAAEAFGFKPDEAKRLGSFESFVYEFERENESYILKITHSFHRTKNLILGEVDWVNYLAINDVPVCQAVNSLNCNLVEVVDVDNSYFLLYVSQKAAGEFIGPDKWNNMLFEKWGRVMGRMHKLAQNYRPSKPAFKRFHWFEDDSIRAEKYLPASQKKVIDKCNLHMEKLKRLPVDKKSYGIIHSDLHYGNFKVDNGSIKVFDFDDCHYNYFAFDLSIPIYYVMLNKEIGIDNIAFGERFMEHFMHGYRKENTIDSSWLGQIPDFLKLRELDLYIIIHREKIFDENDWCRRFMDGKKEKIENDTPVIDIDFTKF